MKKRVLSLFMVLVLCLTLLPTAAFAEGEDVSISGGVIGGGETGGEGGGIYVAPGSPTEGTGGFYVSEGDTRTEIWCTRKPSLIQRGYDGTRDGSTIPINLTFTDGTNEIKLTEGTGFTAKKTFDSADAGSRTVTVEIELIGDAAAKYKLKAGEETFTIGGYIDKAHPDLTVSLSKAACTVGEKILPLLSVEGAPEGAAVTYYYTPLDSGYSEFEGSEAVPAIDGNTAISVPGTYYVYAKTGGTKNYEEERSTTAELTVNEAVVEAASVTKADGTVSGTYKTLPAALNAAQDGDTVKLLADHVTDWDAVYASEEQPAVVKSTITLDLNGKTVDYLIVGEVVPDEEGGILETFYGNLTVVDNIQGGSHGKIKDLEFVQGSLAIQGGQIGDSDGGGLTCNENSGTVTISGGTVYNAKVGKGVVVTVNGGLLHEGQWINNGTLNITGGTFGRVKFYNNSGTISISGGTFGSLQNLDNGSFQIAPISLLAPGHAFYDTYNENIVKDGSIKGDLQNVTVKEHTHTMVNSKCACGLSCTHTNAEGASTIGKDGKCTACGTQFTAIIGETYYTDVKSALNAAADGQTIKLLANEMLSDGIYVSKTLTLDLNGHSLSGYSLNVGGLTATSQVRTGNLTVIDSSGGNGAVGVTVRNGGTLVFKPENDNTTLLQLEVWGGTVELYGGKISRSGLRLNNGITLGNLLPGGAGLAYYRGDTQLTLEEAASQTCDLVVKSCSHGGKNGFDNSSATCPYCGVAAVAETALYNGEGNRLQRKFADLQTALDADRDGGAEFKLLTDVTGDYTIDGKQNTGLDLNGHSIKGTVTVKGIKGDYITTTLSNTQNTTTASIDKVVACDGAELAGSKYPAVIGTLTLAEGATWKTILNGTELGYKVLNADGTHKWYAPEDVNGSQLNNVIINRLPITSKTLSLKVGGKNLTGNSPKAERGTTVQLCASCNASGADVSIYIGETVGNSLPIYRQKKAEYKKIGSTWYYVVDLDASKIGTYDIYFTASKDGYKVTSSHKTLTVTKPNLSNAEITFPYGNEAVFNYLSATGVPTFVVKYNGKEMERDALIITGDTFDGVGPCMLTVKAAENSNYTGSKSAGWTVRPLKITASGANVVKTYDGTADLPANASITFKSVDSMYTGVAFGLSKGTDYQLLDARYDSPNAGEEKTVSFTVKLLEEGYVFEDGTRETSLALKGSTVKINKADAPNTSSLWLEQHVFNELAKTYEIDLKTLLPGLSVFCEYGEITYGTPRVTFTDTAYQGGDATLTNGVLRLPIASANTSKSEIGTVTIEVNSTNYQTFELTLHVIADDKIVLDQTDVAVSASEITYGQTLADSKLTVTGKMKCPRTGNEIPGTFAWKDGTVIPDAGSYEAEWTFTPDEGYEEYAVATGTVIVKVDKAQLQNVSVMQGLPMPLYYTGEPQRAGVSAVGLGVCGERPTFTYSKTENGEYTSEVPAFTEAGTYTVYYKAEAKNHVTATGSFYVQIKPLPISLLTIEKISKTYDGTASVILSTDRLTFFSKAAGRSGITLPNLALSFSNARFTMEQADGSYVDSPEVGGGKALSFTMTLTSNNYVFEGKSEGTTEVSDVFATDDVNRFTITKAAAPTMQPIELTVINGLAKTYLVNLPALPTLGDNCKYGSIKYEACNFDLIGEGGYANSTAMITSNDEFQLTVPAVESQTEGSVGTVGVKITTDNYQDMLLTVEVIAKNKIVPVLDGEITATPITFGQILRVSTITGTMKDDGKTVEGTFEWTDPSTKPDKAGDYQAEWTFTPAEGYEKYATATGTVTIKVNKADPTFTAPTAQENLTYTGQEQALITAGMTDYGTMQYSLTENGTYSQNIPTGTDAGTYTVWYRVFGDANHNDTAPASVPVSIGKKPLPITGVTATSKPYDGTTNADIFSVTFDNVTLNRGTDYTVTANFDDASVDSGKNITATVTLMEQAAKNYALEQSSFPTTGSIIKAAAPDFTKETALTIVNGHEKTYTVTLPALPTLETPKEYGTVTYGAPTVNLSSTYYADGAKVEDGKLILPIQKNDVKTTGSVGTVTVVIKSTNYENITLTVNVNATNKLVPTGEPTLSAKTLTYGQALSAIKLSGKLHDDVNNVDVDGTFEWVDGTFKPAANDSYQAGWKFTPTNQEKYAEVTGTVTIKVNKAATTGEPKYTAITTSGKTLKDAALTTEGSTLNPSDGKLKWVDDEGNVLPDDTRVEANTTYTWRFTPTDTNYTTLTGKIELYHRSSGGGGFYTPSYAVTADKTENGTISVSPKSASKGDTVTITVKPDKGYELDTIKVLDQNGDKVKLTEKDGKYTFKMPDSKVEIQATFVKEAEISPFGDVSTDAYYYEAVKWAQKKGITGGIGNDLFGPNQPCTRAQIATFLWRAAGSPEPKNMSSFSDVPADSYYAKAVAWAVENGITTGTGDGKFSPNAPCTRAQSVTFLYRASGSPAVSDSAAFGDVAENAFYADAVAWAVANGVTNGTTSSTFSPDNGCTRAQIVTFLYRAFNK